LLLDISSDLNEHRLPNDFGIPPSKELEYKNKYSNLEGRNLALSGNLPLNILY
jgi:hypothetical protein